jgi:DNA-binding PadR family transcriptional regulator
MFIEAGEKVTIMLSKINTLLLGLIDQKPVNPYEIQKILIKNNIRSWLPIAESSVYAGIRSLNEKGLIEGEVRKEKNMPEKTLYHITAKGSEVLKKNIAEYLSSLEMDAEMFNIGILLMGQIPKDEAVTILKNKLKAMDQEIFLLKKQLTDGSVPYIHQAIVKHQTYIMFSDGKTIQEILDKIGQAA